MGVCSRISTIFKAKVSKVLDAAEDPRETLDYSYQKQMELLQKVKRSLADVVTSRKTVELQKTKMEADIAKLSDEAKEALKMGREELAREALERKQQYQATVEDLDGQIATLKAQEDQMESSEKRLQAKIIAFRTQKEVIKAQYSTAEAHVRIGEAATGIGEELADVGMAVDRAKDKTERMQARASAIDELTTSGALEDATDPRDPLEKELAAVKRKSAVDDELAALKREVAQ